MASFNRELKTPRIIETFKEKRNPLPFAKETTECFAKKGKGKLVSLETNISSHFRIFVFYIDNLLLLWWKEEGGFFGL